MTGNPRLRAMCLASGVSTAWIGAAATASPMDMRYDTYSGFERTLGGEALDPSTEGTVKKTTKRKAKKKVRADRAAKKATKKKTKRAYSARKKATRTRTTAKKAKISQVSDGIEDYEVDFDLFFEEKEEAFGITILTVLEEEETQALAFGMLVPDALASSFVGESFSSLFPAISLSDVINAMLSDNEDMISTYADVMLFSTVLLSLNEDLTSFSGAWVTFSAAEGVGGVGELEGQMFGTIELSIPAPAASIPFTVLCLAGLRRRR